MKTLVFMLFLATSAFAQSPQAQRSVFSIPLGVKFEIPECTRDTRHAELVSDLEKSIDQARADNVAIAKSISPQSEADEKERQRQEPRIDLPKRITYAINQEETCFEWPSHRAYVEADSPIGTETVDVLFTPSNSPDMLSKASVSVDVIEGRTEAVSFDTAGIHDQRSTLSALEKKYGKPSTLTIERKQNAFGAQFSSYLATWKFPNLNVIFRGTEGRYDEGTVEIETKRAADYRKMLQREAKGASPKL